MRLYRNEVMQRYYAGIPVSLRRPYRTFKHYHISYIIQYNINILSCTQECCTGLACPARNPWKRSMPSPEPRVSVRWILIIRYIILLYIIYICYILRCGNKCFKYMYIYIWNIYLKIYSYLKHSFPERRIQPLCLNYAIFHPKHEYRGHISKLWSHLSRSF